MQKLDFTIPAFGERTVQSPISLSGRNDDYIANYEDDTQRILYNIDTSQDARTLNFAQSDLLEKAGPREKIYFNPVSY